MDRALNSHHRAEPTPTVLLLMTISPASIMHPLIRPPGGYPTQYPAMLVSQTGARTLGPPGCFRPTIRTSRRQSDRQTPKVWLLSRSRPPYRVGRSTV